MKYKVELKPKALKDLEDIPTPDRVKILAKMKLLEDDLRGDVKKLTEHTPEYRMRVGDWRILFEVDAGKVIVYRVLHRREAYR